MRPASILWFERIWLGALALSLIVAVLDWRGTSEGVGTVAAIATLAALATITILLVLLVSRRRNGTAKWVLAVIALLAAAGIANNVSVGSNSPRDLTDLALELVQVAATSLLFTSSARAWLAAPHTTPKSAEKLERTFE
jgi:hypothetical protein